MTIALAATYRESLLDSSAPDLSSVNLKIAAMSASYVYDAAHDFHSDLSNIIATTGNLGTKTITDGVLDAANISLGSPAGGSTITQLWLYYDTATSATSPLIWYTNEDAAAAAISIATDGAEITLNFNASGIFRV
jgi:hypothetical protein